MAKHTRTNDDTLDDEEVAGAYDFFHKGEPDLFIWTGKEYYEKEGNENVTSFGKRWIDYAPVIEIAEDEIIVEQGRKILNVRLVEITLKVYLVYKVMKEHI